MAWVELAPDIKPADGECVAVTVAGKPVVLVNLNDRLFAVAGICTHQYARLAEGYIEDEFIECPLHQGRFHIPTGKADGGIVTRDLETYEVVESDGAIKVATEPSAA